MHQVFVEGSLQWLHSFFYYYHSIYYLEELQLVDIDDPWDLSMLYFVLLPVIQLHLDILRAGWAHHRCVQKETELHNSCGYHDSEILQKLMIQHFLD